jgi:hypothetical protein
MMAAFAVAVTLLTEPLTLPFPAAGGIVPLAAGITKILFRRGQSRMGADTPVRLASTSRHIQPDFGGMDFLQNHAPSIRHPEGFLVPLHAM